jgi:hypothetical protein
MPTPFHAVAAKRVGGCLHPKNPVIQSKMLSEPNIQCKMTRIFILKKIQ